MKSYVAYASDFRNRHRVVYLDSPLQTVDTRLTVRSMRRAIARAYRNTLEFLARENKNHP